MKDRSGHVFEATYFRVIALLWLRIESAVVCMPCFSTTVPVLPVIRKLAFPDPVFGRKSIRVKAGFESRRVRVDGNSGRGGQFNKQGAAASAVVAGPEVVDMERVTFVSQN